jgi:hypothetical protein
MQRKFLKIDIKLKQGVYKIASFFIGTDGSLYIAHPKTNFAREKNDSRISAIKFSYHPKNKDHLTGFSQFTIGSQGDRIKMPKGFKKLRNSFENIDKPESLICLSLLDLRTINKRGAMLDSGNGRGNYKNYILLEGEKYKNLTLNIFLAGRAEYIDSSIHKYSEIFTFDFNGIALIVTVKDYWAGDKNKENNQT